MTIINKLSYINNIDDGQPLASSANVAAGASGGSGSFTTGGGGDFTTTNTNSIVINDDSNNLATNNNNNTTISGSFGSLVRETRGHLSNIWGSVTQVNYSM